MKKSVWLVLSLIVLSLLAACTEFPLSIPQTRTATPTALAQSPVTPSPTENSTETSTNTEPQILRIWLPPQFDPNAETEAAGILRARLDTFQTRRPDLILDVRIKAVDGAAGLLDALIVTEDAAPNIMPDLIALQRPAFEKAALQGILHPIEGLSTLLDDPDWFPYARLLAHIHSSAYGLPFSANLFGLAYRPAEDAPALPNIESLNEQGNQILFPADSPSANLSFCLYAASGAPLRDEQGLPRLDPETLTALLSFYQSKSISTKASTIENSEAIWEIFNAQPEIAATVWTDDYFGKTPADAQIVPIPTPNGGTCSLATAWLWALAGTSQYLQPAAVELAEYLSDSEFLSAWTAALGSLPPRPTALDADKTTLHALSLAAQPIPANDIATSLGEIFRTATMSVLRDQVDPEAAAQEVLSGIQ